MYSQNRIAVMTDSQLLQDFAAHGSENAFRALVERHLPLVLGTARRITGNPALAEEIAQTVFLLLARKAPGLDARVLLTGWLYRTATFVATRAVQSEQRRRRREEEAVSMQLNSAESDPAWHRVAPQIDDALNRLGEADRNAVVLRFFEQRPLRDVGTALGVSEEAAKKRVARALDKLRRVLSRRGTDVTAAALLAGLTYEGTQAAASAGLAAKISSGVLAQLAAGAGGSALLAEMLAAWRWAKLKTALFSGVTLVALLTVTPFLVRSVRETSATTAPGTTKTPPGITAKAAPATPTEILSAALTGMLDAPTIELAGEIIPLRTLVVTVLDAATSEPIPGVQLHHQMMMRVGEKPVPPFVTDANGAVKLRLPTRLPGAERMDQFNVWLQHSNYAPRTINWLSTTGQVLSTITTQHTARLEPGLALAAVVEDDAGQPLAGVRIGATGSNHRGYGVGQAEVRVQEYSSFGLALEGAKPLATDRNGRFRFEHFPSDLRALMLELQTPDDARHKFRTPEGAWLSADAMPEVSFDEMKRGTARFTIPRGVTVHGLVVDASGEPVRAAQVVEATQWGNLKVLSRNITDAEGRFHLTNRQPREIILAASAEGFATTSQLVSIAPGMEEVRLVLPPELSLRGRVVDQTGQPMPEVKVSVTDIYNEGTAFEWKSQTDAEGRFNWRGAPTNEVALTFWWETTQRVVRLRALAQEAEIVFSKTSSERVRVTGRVTDATSGAAVGNFTVKVSHTTSGSGLPDEARRTHPGTNGTLDVTVAMEDIPVGMMPAWVLQIEAEGYDPVFTRTFSFEEGDQRLNFALQPGGDLEITVRDPDGGAVTRAELIVVQEGRAHVSPRPGHVSHGAFTSVAKPDGSFKLAKPLKARAVVVFHDSGWAVLPLAVGQRKLDVSLAPWGRIEGVLERGGEPLAGEDVLLAPLLWDNGALLHVLYNARTDAAGRFVFAKVPAGEFELSWVSASWQRMGEPSVKARQTPVTVQSGETSPVNLTEPGRLVVARFEPAKSSRPLDWAKALVTLSRDVHMTKAPARSDFSSMDSYNVAMRHWASHPTVLSAARQQRTFVARLAADGTASFDDVAPGRYLLEVKLPVDSSDRSPSTENSARKLLLAVEVPAEAGNDARATAPWPLGNFTLE